MAKNIELGFKYRSKEERGWQRNGFCRFVPFSRPGGLTYMMKLYVLQTWFYIGPPTSGATKWFKISIKLEI